MATTAWKRDIADVAQAWSIGVGRASKDGTLVTDGTKLWSHGVLIGVKDSAGRRIIYARVAPYGRISRGVSRHIITLMYSRECKTVRPSLVYRPDISITKAYSHQQINEHARGCNVAFLPLFGGRRRHVSKWDVQILDAAGVPAVIDYTCGFLVSRVRVPFVYRDATSIILRMKCGDEDKVSLLRACMSGEQTLLQTKTRACFALAGEEWW